MTDKTISLEEFRELGLLQEINRQWLHPRGMALAFTVEEAGVSFHSILDCRDDPEGFMYSEDEELSEKAKNYSYELMESKVKARVKLLGQVIQPIKKVIKE